MNFVVFLAKGLLRAPKASISTEVCLVKLWRHECWRVFADKLTTLEDKAAFRKELDLQTAFLGRVVLDSPQVKGALPAESHFSGIAYLTDFIRESIYLYSTQLIKCFHLTFA